MRRKGYRGVGCVKRSLSKCEGICRTYVSPQGKVLPCMTFGTPMEEKFPNMLETPLEEILDESLYMPWWTCA